MLQWTVVHMHTLNLHWCMLVCGYRVLSVVITYIAAVYTVTLLHLLYKSVLDPMHFSSRNLECYHNETRRYYTTVQQHFHCANTMSQKCHGTTRQTREAQSSNMHGSQAAGHQYGSQ